MVLELEMTEKRCFNKLLPAGLALVILATQGLATATQATVAANKPNIVFIMVDDLGPEWISSYGAEGIQTPNIDKLAAGGMKFTNAYSMPQCTPTRVTLLTGQYPFRHGWVNHWDVPRWGAGCHFDPKHNVSFARLLKDAGYATAIAGCMPGEIVTLGCDSLHPGLRSDAASRLRRAKTPLNTWLKRNSCSWRLSRLSPSTCTPCKRSVTVTPNCEIL